LTNGGIWINTKILVVEDPPLIRRMIQDVLAKGGFHDVEAVSHGKAAWDRLSDEGESFDPAIADIEMPKMDGLTLTKKLKKTIVCDIYQ